MASKNPIIAEFTAFDKRGNGSYQENFSVESHEELKTAVQEFDKNCPFSKYEMETYAAHADGSDLTEEEREWFEEQDETEDIGF